MKFATLYLELTNSTEMIRALLAGIAQEEAQTKPSADGSVPKGTAITARIISFASVAL